MNTNNKIPIKGIRIRTLNLIMISISCIMYILLIGASVQALQKYEAMVYATDDYISCEEDAALLADGSNYLTEQVRLFAVTRDMQYLENYFTEVYVTKRRDNVLDRLKTYDVDEKISNSLKTALEQSNRLMEVEIYSMKLVSEAQNYDITNYDDIKNTELTEEDKSLPPESMIQKAQDLVFSSSYQDSKNTISNHISLFLSDVVKHTRQKQESSTINLKRILRSQQILISVLFMENILVFILIIWLIIKPLQIYVNNIKNEKMLEITGSYEFKYLALTYNNIFELNAANESTLRYQAEHDPLTGIINRGAFDHLREVLKQKLEPFALLIIDVDKFKLVNDGYGHEIGDQVLKKVAKLLEDSFRNTDFPARIGGDEFAVIVTNATEDMKSMILEKVNAMNDVLLHPTDGLPEVSLSVGAAFSECTFTEDLYKHADIALYEVKEHGRCGCRFYEGQDRA